MRKFFSLFIFAIICVLSAVYAMASLANRATPSDVLALHPDEEIINISTADGLEIKGSYIAGAAEDSPAILMLHGNGGSRAQFARHLQIYNEAGYAVLAIDFRGHGGSSDAPKSYGVYESIDAYAAFDFLKVKQQGAKIGVLGLSLGGSAALIGDNGPLAADAMILQAVFPDIKRAIGNRMGYILEPMLSNQSYIRYDRSPSSISPIESAQQFKGSALLIGGANDIYTPPAEIEAMHDVMSGPKWVWIIGGLNHAQMSGLNDDVYMTRTLLFFDENLK